MGSGKGTSKRVQTQRNTTRIPSTLGKAFTSRNVLIDVDLWNKWVKENGLSNTTFNEYYLGRKNDRSFGDFDGVGFVLTEIMRDVLDNKFFFDYLDDTFDFNDALKNINYTDYKIKYEDINGQYTITFIDKGFVAASVISDSGVALYKQMKTSQQDDYSPLMAVRHILSAIINDQK